MAIGVLAYGSLITNPGAELSAVIVGRTHGVLTPFCVEYARSSNARCGAPTLIPVGADGSPVNAVVFEVTASADEAAAIVYRREINKVGSGLPYREPARDSKNAVWIDRIEGLAGFDLVLSTRIAANIHPLSADILADLAIGSARKLGDGRDGITYLMEAKKCGIVTPLTSAYETSILQKTGAGDLASALALIRQQASGG